ncbi:MAG: tripartite tricarboxylate transporter substrate binding protein [Geminicoccaceae bacterium]|nr:MAG: tripartite tricarboxylate transporter substrate binding protein [Geminicoccaceae bacterium]
MRLVHCAAALAVLAAAPAAADYPTRALQGVIMWGAGGATDTVSRAIQPHAEAALGRDIVMTNRSGGTGAIATRYVQAQRADGYTLLFGAENPQLHKVLGLADIDYDDFYPVNILARGVAIVVTTADAPWQSFGELVAEAQADPGAIRMGATGPGGLPHVVGSMLASGVEFPVTAVPYDGEGPALTAMLGGAVDFMPVGLSAAAEHIRAGRVRPLAVVDTAEVDLLPGVPPITAEFPVFEDYLPWGPFYGVFVRRDTPEAITATLVEAFHGAASVAEFEELMEARGNVMMNLTGDEADAFLDRWRSVTSWIMYDAGAAQVSPDSVGIARP